MRFSTLIKDSKVDIFGGTDFLYDLLKIFLNNIFSKIFTSSSDFITLKPPDPEVLIYQTSGSGGFETASTL